MWERIFQNEFIWVKYESIIFRKFKVNVIENTFSVLFCFRWKFILHVCAQCDYYGSCGLLCVEFLLCIELEEP